MQLPGAEMIEGDGSDDRPLLTLLLAALTKNGTGKSLVFWKLDRFSRAGEEQEILLRMLWNAHVTVCSTFPGEESMLSGDTLDPQRTFTRQVLAASARFERATILARTKLGRRAKAARGLFVNSKPPTGYRLVKGDLVIEPDGAHLVRCVHYLRQQDLSVRAIADELGLRFGISGVTHTRVARILRTKALYQGVLVDPYDGARHDRPDLRILPTEWAPWAEQHDSAAHNAR